MWSFRRFPRIFDSITDPIMGFISDNTKSKWGKEKTICVFGGINMGIFYVLMWQLEKIAVQLTFGTSFIILFFI